ncbi:MAG: hypothetical protein IH588_07240 [Anaerolineales bacterium]|nr:hypothetical protein [Anaerolineales bacterium]
MSDIQNLIKMLHSNNPNMRYDACEELRVSHQPLPQEAIDALNSATNDSDPDVADAAQRALALHAPKLAPDVVKVEAQEETIDEPPSNVNWLLVKVGSGAFISIIATTVAAGYFERGCTNSNYFGNLFFIFIVTWISWLAVSSLVRGKSSSAHLGGMFLSLLVVLVGAFPCITMIGFWIAPVCN